MSNESCFIPPRPDSPQFPQLAIGAAYRVLVIWRTRRSPVRRRLPFNDEAVGSVSTSGRGLESGECPHVRFDRA